MNLTEIQLFWALMIECGIIMIACIARYIWIIKHPKKPISPVGSINYIQKVCEAETLTCVRRFDLMEFKYLKMDRPDHKERIEYEMNKAILEATKPFIHYTQLETMDYVEIQAELIVYKSPAES